ncbi:MAG: hypothetical protein ACOZBH_01965 [Patescibacteria group bacterium]
MSEGKVSAGSVFSIVTVIMMVAVLVVVLVIAFKGDGQPQPAPASTVAATSSTATPSGIGISDLNALGSSMNQRMDGFDGRLGGVEREVGEVKQGLVDVRNDLKEMPEVMRQMLVESGGRGIPMGCNGLSNCGRSCPDGTTGYRVADTLPDGRRVYYIKCDKVRTRRAAPPAAQPSAEGATRHVKETWAYPVPGGGWSGYETRSVQ